MIHTNFTTTLMSQPIFAIIIDPNRFRFLSTANKKTAGEGARRYPLPFTRSGYGAVARYPRLWSRRRPSSPTRWRFRREAPGPSSTRSARRFSTSARLSV